ncbi:MAG TPA: hypothetical protein VFZ56_03510 [Gemmatimonadaceae bacterium]
MAELIHRHSTAVVTASGARYQAVVYGEERSDGTWEGWIEFQPMGDGPQLRTGQETSQPNRQAIEYWASGLEPLYLDGAFQRALRSGET